MSAANANLIGLGTITRREVVRILRIWSQTLLPSAITMTLYFVIFGRMVGSRIGEIAPGIGYIDYIVPGLIMMAVITNSSSSRFALLRIDRTVIPRADNAENSELRS